MDGVGAYGAGGQERRRSRGQLADDIRAGPITWRNAFVLSVEAKDAAIGSRALKPWKVVFDQRARRLYLLGERSLVSLPKAPEPDARFKLGFFCEFHREGIRLLEVDSGYAFERAGLRAGDVISSVDGVSAAEWVSRRAPSEILTKPRVTLNVERDGKTFETVLVQGPDEP